MQIPFRPVQCYSNTVKSKSEDQGYFLQERRKDHTMLRTSSSTDAFISMEFKEKKHTKLITVTFIIGFIEGRDTAKHRSTGPAVLSMGKKKTDDKLLVTILIAPCGKEIHWSTEGISFKSKEKLNGSDRY